MTRETTEAMASRQRHLKGLALTAAGLFSTKLFGATIIASNMLSNL